MSISLFKKWYPVLASVVFCSASVNTFGAVGPERWADHPEWLWFDDFESTSALSTKYQDVSTTGLTVTTADKFQGSRSLCQKYTVGMVDAGWIIRVNNSGFPSHLYMRWYHKFEKGFTGFPPKMARMRYRPRSGDWKSVFSVCAWIQNSKVVADVTAKNSTQVNSTGWLPVTVSNFSFANSANVGRWVCFEMELLLNTPGKADGLYRIWADDVLILERKNADIRGPYNYLVNEVMLDCYWNDGSPKAQSRYYDNFVISTKRIGMIKTTEVKNTQHMMLQQVKNNSQPTLQLNIGNGNSSYINRAQESNRVYFLNGAKLSKSAKDQRPVSTGITINKH